MFAKKAKIYYGLFILCETKARKHSCFSGEKDFVSNCLCEILSIKQLTKKLERKVFWKMLVRGAKKFPKKCLEWWLESYKGFLAVGCSGLEIVTPFYLKD